MATTGNDLRPTPVLDLAERSWTGSPSSANFLAPNALILPPFLTPLVTSSPDGEPVQVVAGRAQTVIDLTGDEPDLLLENNHDPVVEGSSTRASRPPHFERDIIDVDALPDSPDRPPASLRPSSPEVEVTGARLLPRVVHRHRAVPPARPMEPRPAQTVAWISQSGHAVFRRFNPGGIGPPRHLLNQVAHPRQSLSGPLSSQEVQRQREEIINLETRARLENLETRARLDTSNPWRHYQINQQQQAVRNGLSQADAEAFSSNTNVDGFQLPHLSYELVALADQPESYSPPSPPREGFTRSPKEDDVIVCPNCDDELGTGDTDLKRSVWFVKGCGHVCFRLFGYSHAIF